MAKVNENKSIISEMFTEKELAELNFTPEEVDILEGAEALNRALNFMPDSEKEMDAFFEKVEKEFPKGKPVEETLAHYQELIEKDPEFIQQMVTMSLIIDEVDVVPPPKAEKVSVGEIKNLKASDSQKETIKAINDILKNMK